MAANPTATAAWNAAPLTKFRTPRVRRDAVARPALLERLKLSVEQSPVTLVCAPGGYGKTSLLAQLAARFAGGAGQGNAVLWISLDEDDNDRHRFFAALLRAIEPLPVAWDVPPATLLTSTAGSDSQVRAALAAFVNALCTAPVQRLVLVLDDLHRIDRHDVHEMIESLIERLPDHVAVVIGSRVEPPLPLARWRAHGELGEFVPWDLQFTEAEALSLAAARLGADPDPAAIRDVWRRMHGWAAGLTMALQSNRPRAEGPVGGLETSDRHLFAYLAQEILTDLPEPMREFCLRSSVLSELSPAACEAVTGHTDSKSLLESLYRRNLFVTATDDSVPVLRFHDLFRDFLESELEKRYPEQLQQLHERAGHVESSMTKAIAHFMRAASWPDAMRLIAANGEAMLAEGDHPLLERWLDQIPEEVRRADPKLCYLRGLCAWLRWDWVRARQELQPAVDGLVAAEQGALRVRAMFLLVDACNSSGSPDRAWNLLEQLAAIPLDRLSRAHLALQRAWYLLLSGDPRGVGDALTELIEHAEADPASVCPRTADRFHLLCIGLPKVADCFERYFGLTEIIRGDTGAPWQLAALAVGAWGHFWHGRREPVLQILARGETLHQRFGGMRLISERLLQFRSLFHAASGQFEQATALGRRLVDALQAPEASSHRASWLRAYQHALARMYWMAGDFENFRALAPALLAPRATTEWPFIDTALELVRGQVAMLREDWRTAEAALQQAVRTHQRFRLPMTYGDPRVSLAYLYLTRGQRDRAWEAFEPVMQEVLNDEAIGLLLLEPARVVDALIDVIPDDVQSQAAFDVFASRIALWRPGRASPAVAAGPLAALSEREQEVLAQVAAGASNKHIARDLSLSLHTVKRHIANILDKLDCASRGQAADFYRRAQSAAASQPAVT
jgi:LuxR family maltose regulon positive regulatory protein